MPEKPPKRKFNLKYHVLSDTDYCVRKEQLDDMANKAVYTGNPKHKKNPGDFDLVPPSDPRPFASLCDNANIFRREEAQRLLKNAFRLGLVDSRSKPGEWPKIVWMVSESSMVLQGMYEKIDGHYHGFPVLDEEDPIRDEVLKVWRIRNGTWH